MEKTESDYAWDLMIELRQEMMEAQRIRTQIMGFKITFVSVVIGLVLANSSSVPMQLLVIPAVGAVFFDMLIVSYNRAIDWIAFYSFSQVEPMISLKFRPQINWESYTPAPDARSGYLSIIANFGITSLSIIPALISLFRPFNFSISLPLLFLLIISAVYDLVLHIQLRRRKRTYNLKYKEE